MGWDTDKMPMDYLERRVIYYKKKKGKMKGFLKDDWFIKKYGGISNATKSVNGVLLNIDKKIKLFKRAIEILRLNEFNDTIENK